MKDKAKCTEVEVDRLCQELYQENRKFTPMYPWVFVRVAQREQMRNGIWCPAVQNKIYHEGIVLAVWKPFMEYKIYDGEDVITPRHSELSPGDHVLFNHFAGVPLEGYDRDRYRVVRECDYKENEQGGIFASVTYEGQATKPVEKMKAIITAKLETLVHEGVERMEMARVLTAAVEDDFLLVDRDVASVTISGR